LGKPQDRRPAPILRDSGIPRNGNPGEPGSRKATANPPPVGMVAGYEWGVSSSSVRPLSSARREPPERGRTTGKSSCWRRPWGCRGDRFAPISSPGCHGPSTREFVARIKPSGPPRPPRPRRRRRPHRQAGLGADDGHQRAPSGTRTCVTGSRDCSSSGERPEGRQRRRPRRRFVASPLHYANLVDPAFRSVASASPRRRRRPLRRRGVHGAPGADRR